MCNITHLFLIPFLIYLVQSKSAISPKVLLSVFDHFQLLDPIIQNNNNYLDIRQQADMFRLLSKIGHQTSFNILNNQSLSRTSLIIFTEIVDFKVDFGSPASSVLVITKLENVEHDLGNKNVSIDEEVYFLDVLTLNIYETYNVNDHQIIHELGHFEVNDLEDKVDFIANKKFPLSMIERRDDFQGVTFIGMTDLEGPWVIIPDDFEIKATFFPGNQTYDVTGIVSGVYIDILHSVEALLNFTTKLYLRKDRKWGIPSKLEVSKSNQSLTWLNSKDLVIFWNSFSLDFQRTFWIWNTV